MKRNPLNLLVIVLFLGAFIIAGIQPSEAAEEHHQAGVKASTASPSESSRTAETPSSESGEGSEMAGMMSNSEDEDDQGVMGLMREQDIMSMMMSHMMGGPGGMRNFMGPMGSRHGRGHHRGLAQMARALNSLNLTSKQWDQVHALARKQMEKMVDLWAQRMKLRIDLAGLRWDKEIDPQKVKELFAKKGEVKAEMFLTGLEYWRELAKILTPEQLKELEAFRGYNPPIEKVKPR